MPYRVEDLKPGDVVLVEGVGPLARAIKWSTGSPFSHVALVGDGHLIEALWTVSRSPLGKYAAKAGWAYRVAGATDEQRAKAVAWAEGRVGAKYGIREIALDAAKFDLHWTPRLRHPLTRLTCSGLVAQAYREAGVVLTWASFPAPSDLSASPLLVGPRPWVA